MLAFVGKDGVRSFIDDFNEEKKINFQNVCKIRNILLKTLKINSYVRMIEINFSLLPRKKSL